MKKRNNLRCVEMLYIHIFPLQIPLNMKLIEGGGILV